MQIKKRLLASLFVILFYQTGKPCDICGCSVGGMYVGILPQFQNHFVGLRYQYREFTSTHTYNQVTYYSTDRFHTMELWGRFYPHRKVQLMAFMPVNYFTKNENERVTSTIGPGDLTVLANYMAYNTPDTAITWWKHNLLVGGGLKLPTGDFNHYRNDTLLNPNLQSGTGSWDFLANATYTVRYKKVGMNLEANARFNTTNVHGYRFGHRFNGAVRFFLWTKIKSTSFVPHVSFLIDYALKDRNRNLIVLESGGISVTPQLGLDLYLKERWMIGAFASHKVWDYLGNGTIQSGWRFGVQSIFIF